MDVRLSWRRAGIEEVAAMSLRIPEFDDPYDDAVWAARLEGRDHLVQIGQIEGRDAGFKVGYALSDHDLYSWVGGVVPSGRGFGLGQFLLEAQEAWAVERGYRRILVKSGNRFPAMMRLLLGNGYLVSRLEERGEGLVNHLVHFDKTLGGVPERG